MPNTTSETELTLADIRAEIRRVERVLAEKGKDSMTGVGSTGRRPGPYLEELRRQAISYANTQAGGHIDYADKFALYCAEIAMGIERTVY